MRRRGMRMYRTFGSPFQASLTASSGKLVNGELNLAAGAAANNSPAPVRRSLTATLRLYLAERPQSSIGWFAALADPQLSASISAMHAALSFAWTLQELAARAGMSRSTFAERFRERIGETPIAYLTRWRMILAGEKLINGRDTLARIAMSLGYESEHAFNTAFKRVMGRSPRQYARAGAEE